MATEPDFQSAQLVNDRPTSLLLTSDGQSRDDFSTPPPPPPPPAHEAHMVAPIETVPATPSRVRDVPRDQGDVALIASVVSFEQTIRRLLTANGGPRMHRWPVQGDTPGAERIGVAFIGPDLDVEAMAARAEQINRNNPGIYLVLVSEPRAGLFERALRAGVRDVLAPNANDDAILDVLERGFEHAVRWRASLPSAAAAQTVDTKRKIISVLAPKGGVGKTFCTSNLSMALNQYEMGKVAVIDLDLQFGDVSGALHLSPEHTVADAARALQTTDSGALGSMLKVFLTPHESGLYVLAGPDDPAEADDVTFQQSVDITKALSNSFEYVVVDTCAGLDPHALSVTEMSTDLVFVCSVDVSSVRSLRRELDALDRLGMTHQTRHLIINRFDAPGGARPEDVEVAVGMRATVTLPVDRNVLAAANQGVPITVADPKSAIAKKFLGFAESIIGIESTVEAAPKKVPFWKRGR
jgi:pilus assembly protein CpaE